MTERAAALGGQLTAGREPLKGGGEVGGGFAVRARLGPLETGPLEPR